jgi:hypothetical protein
MNTQTKPRSRGKATTKPTITGTPAPATAEHDEQITVSREYFEALQNGVAGSVAPEDSFMPEFASNAAERLAEDLRGLYEAIIEAGREVELQFADRVLALHFRARAIALAPCKPVGAKVTS